MAKLFLGRVDSFGEKTGKARIWPWALGMLIVGQQMINGAKNPNVKDNVPATITHPVDSKTGQHILNHAGLPLECVTLLDDKETPGVIQPSDRPRIIGVSCNFEGSPTTTVLTATSTNPAPVTIG